MTENEDVANIVMAYAGVREGLRKGGNKSRVDLRTATKERIMKYGIKKGVFMGKKGEREYKTYWGF